MRRLVAVVAVVVACLAVSSSTDSTADPTSKTKLKPKIGAKDAQPAKGFWKILVKKGAKWTLKETVGSSPSTITIETYDVRKVGTADVARLRWTQIFPDGKKEDIGDTEVGRYTQVAVTADGLYLLYAAQDDARVAEMLKGKPSRSDPPKAYSGTKQNHGRYLTVMSADQVCVGQGALPSDGECADTCDGTLCISATDGPVSLMGNWAPGVTVFEAP